MVGVGRVTHAEEKSQGDDGKETDHRYENRPQLLSITLP
jgi:hypothetical protein